MGKEKNKFDNEENSNLKNSNFKKSENSGLDDENSDEMKGQNSCCDDNCHCQNENHENDCGCKEKHHHGEHNCGCEDGEHKEGKGGKCHKQKNCCNEDEHQSGSESEEEFFDEDDMEDFEDYENPKVYGDGCQCGGGHKNHSNHHECQSKEQEYLQIAQRLKADFDNYRKHVSEELDRAKDDGIESVIEAFLPGLDAFAEAKKSISDEAVLQGVNMIENKILDALSSLKVEKIEAVGQQFDPHKHNVIAAMHDENQEDGIVLMEYQSGWQRNGKVIRYSKVVVNKLD